MISRRFELALLHGQLEKFHALARDKSGDYWRPDLGSRQKPLERRDILVMPELNAALGHASQTSDPGQVSGTLLDVADVLDLRQTSEQRRLQIHAGERRNVVNKDWDRDGRSDIAIVAVELCLGERPMRHRDNLHAVGTELLRVPGEPNRLLG